MKNFKLLTLTAMLLMASFGESQVVIMNGDTVNNAVIPSDNIDTIYYCSTVSVIIQSNDTVGIPPHPEVWGPTVPGKRILTTNPTFLPLPQDTTMGIVYAYYRNSHLANWRDTSADGWYHYDTAAEQVRWYSNDIHLIKKFPSSKICWVSVDSDFMHNVIIWDTAGFATEDIDSVKIYYYITLNTRKLLSTLPSVGRTYYVDSVNNPQSGTFKYLLTGVNSCGNEDTNSAWQTTAWITQTGSTFNVSSPYTVKGDPTPVSYYILYRDTTGTGHNWDSIFETPGTVLNDPNYAHYPNAKYYVAAVLNMPGCTTPAIVNRIESVIINKSKSNRLTNNIAGIASVKDAFMLEIYPNPNDRKFNITITNESSRSAVEIYNALGQKVYAEDLLNGNNRVDMGKQAAGIYLYRIIGVDGTAQDSGKFIVE